MFGIGLRFVVERCVAEAGLVGLNDGFQQHDQSGEMRFRKAIN
jgi:hypothetical protein